MLEPLTAAPAASLTNSPDFVTGDVYLTLPRAPETWVVQDLLPAGGLCNIFGQPKYGKSFAALQMAYAIAAGEPEWLGFPIMTSGPVCYLQLDTPRSLWAERIEDMKATGMDPSVIYFADSEVAPYPFDIAKGDQGGVWLRTQLNRIKPVALFLDTTREIHRGDENDSDHMQQVLAALIIATRPAACVLISHATKENMLIPAAVRDENLGDNRGSGFIGYRMDGTVKITPSGFTYHGRTTEKRQVRASRLPGGWWKVNQSEVDSHLAAVIADTRLTTDSAKARALADRIGRSENACRHLIRRAV